MSTRVLWEGSFFANHSLALVNRELVGRLAMSSDVRVGIVSGEPRTQLAWDLERVAQLRRLEGAGSRADVVVRHRWPLNPAPPAAGKWVIFQPWEFGAIPRDWYEPMRFGADEVWVYSSFNKRCYVESGIPEEKIRVIPLGVHEAMLGAAQPFPLRTRKRFKFLFVGGTIARKGIDLLIDAYRREFTSADDVCLVVKDFGVGSFYRNQTYDQFIRELRRDPRMPEIEYLDDELTSGQIRNLYHSCDCLVHPFRGEGFGLPIAEAMACGLPVIVPDQGGAADFCSADTAVVLPGRRVQLPPVHARGLNTVAAPWWIEVSVSDLRERMRAVSRDPDSVRAIAERGQAVIRDRFTWDAAAARAARGLLDLASEGGAPLRGDRERQSRLWAETAIRCWQQGDREGAVRSFATARSHNEDDDVLFNLAVLTLEAGDPAGARELLNLLRDRIGERRDAEPETAAEVENLLGVCHVTLGDLAAARRHFEAALGRVPGQEVALRNLREMEALEPIPSVAG